MQILNYLSNEKLLVKVYLAFEKLKVNTLISKLNIASICSKLYSQHKILSFNLREQLKFFK